MKSVAPNTAGSTREPGTGVSPKWRQVGLLACAGALAASAMLSFDHWGAMALPGCGAGSACGRAAASAWGTVPGLNWPMSLVGFAYFAAMLVGWLVSPRGFAPAMRVVVGIGAILSIVYLGVIAVERLFCAY